MINKETLDSSRNQLIKSLWLDARKEAEQEILKARSEAEKVIEKCRLLKEKEMALAAEKARSEAMPQVFRIENQAHNRARQLVLQGRHAFLDSCFEEVLGLIGRDIGFHEDMRSSFPDLLRQALSALDGEEKIEILLNPDDLESARLILNDVGLKYDLDTDEKIYGGVLVKADGGSIIVDNTLGNRLSILRETPPTDLLEMINLD